MRGVAISLICCLIPCVAASQTGRVPASAGATAADTLTIRLTSFRFQPEHVRLRAGRPARLRLINDSDGRHDFSAPAFFRASSYPPGSSAPVAGKVDVPAHAAAEVLVVPERPGTFPVECTHFLHSLFGMTGVIDVVAP